MLVSKVLGGLFGLCIMLFAALPAKAVSLDNSFSFIRIDWRGSFGPMVIGAKAIERNGEAYLCGIGWVQPFKSGQYSSSSLAVLPEVTRQLQFSIAGTRLRGATGRFTYVNGEDAAAKADIQCSPTGVAWTAAMDGARTEIDANSIVIRR